MKPYAIFADQHAHNWSSFATTNADGVNSRLAVMLDELQRGALELKGLGGEDLFFAGDLFHTRGKLDPEVFNPVFDRIRRLIDMGFKIHAIPGNHDLKGKETTKLGNAIQALSALRDFDVITEPEGIFGTSVYMIPWRHDLEILKNDLVRVLPKDRAKTDVIIHAGIDGVLAHDPGGALSAAELAKLGYRRIFAGHYHNHKVMEGGKVISIGATAHQTWNDVGTKAGYLIVYPDRVDYRASHAPSFVDLDPTVDEEDIAILVESNFVRVRDYKLGDMEAKKFRDELFKLGAKGVSMQIPREVVSARTTGTSGSKSPTIAESISNFVDELAPDDPDDIKRGCAEILSVVQSVAA